MKFSEFPYARLDKDEQLKQVDKIINDIRCAKSAKEQIEAFANFDNFSNRLSTQGTIAEIRHTIDTTDEFYENESNYYNEISPIFEEKAHEADTLLLNSPFKKELIAEMGEIVFTNAQLKQKAFTPEIIPLMQEENALTSEYQKLYASAKIPFMGKTYTVAQLVPYKLSPDREIRKAAYIAEGGFFDENQAQFDELFDKLIKNRTAQAQKLGFADFTELGYIRQNRNCYDKKAVGNFRRQVIEDIVPVVKKIKENQQKRIGVDKLKFYDDSFCFKDGNPKPKGTADELLAAAKTMYTQMSPQTAEFIKQMFDLDLFDVLAKDGKAPGGYCTDIQDYKCPFIFSNFNGTSDDVDVLTHEAGHAFAAFQAFKTSKWTSTFQGTMDCCETHSMAMEFLTMPWHELFFKEDTMRYEVAHLEDSVNFIPYGCMVDHFQEICYEKPNMSPKERNEVWLKLESEYRPYIDFDNLPFYSRGGGYQRQLHIYLYPFYYVDYCMAQSLALQFFTLSLKNRDEAWQKYLDFVNVGGKKNFVDTVKSAGLLSPLDNGSLKEISKAVVAWLDENSI